MIITALCSGINLGRIYCCGMLLLGLLNITLDAIAVCYALQADEGWGMNHPAVSPTQSFSCTGSSKRIGRPSGERLLGGGFPPSHLP